MHKANKQKELQILKCCGFFVLFFPTKKNRRESNSMKGWKQNISKPTYKEILLKNYFPFELTLNSEITPQKQRNQNKKFCKTETL